MKNDDGLGTKRKLLEKIRCMQITRITNAMCRCFCQHSIDDEDYASATIKQTGEKLFQTIGLQIAYGFIKS